MPNDSSQTLLKTVFSQKTAITTTTEDKRRTPTKFIPIRVTNRSMIRDDYREGSSQQMTENTNGVPTNRIHTATAEETLIIGDSILNPISARGMTAEVQKHSKSGAKVQDIIDDITLYIIKSFSSVNTRETITSLSQILHPLLAPSLKTIRKAVIKPNRIRRAGIKSNRLADTMSLVEV